jgi:hypothetical protein
MHDQIKSASPIGAHLAPSLASPRKKSLDTAHKLRSRDLEDFREFKDCCERGAVQPPFQETYVFWMISTFEGERFLCEVPLLAEFVKRSCKRSFLRRRVFCSSRHLLAGVCDGSMNTSTKYSIHRGGGI